MQLFNTGVYLQGWDRSLIKFPPDSQPPALPPPSGQHTFSHPFTIPGTLYNAALATNVPITIAIVYATTVTLVNRYNANRGNRPWAMSKTKAFHYFVVLHNIFLAVYSAWTSVGMFNGIRESVPGPRGEAGLAGTIDGLCKINGPRGLGNAATFSPTASSWGFSNKVLHLAAGGHPEESDAGRMWNEGLAFYGWLFYISKFYEVLDTFIILAKGKRSSTLQTYHHAGAMMCMWSGMRYMAPPIWLFVFLNSAIHAMMYTYYTLSALGYRVPMAIKRSLTTMQIAQFLFGATFAFVHLFVAYKIPVSVPYAFSTADLTSIPADVSMTASSAVATASAGLGAWVKKVALRAAGSEGLAENVQNDRGQTFGIDAVHAAQDLKDREEIRFRDEMHLIGCMDTSGQAFAILFNCIYLTPLTALFVRFFVKSYMRRARRLSLHSAPATTKAAHKDATNGFARRVNGEPAIANGRAANGRSANGHSK